MIIEIDGNKRNAKKNYLRGFWSEWTPERIKGAFNFGHGTMEDLIEHAELNKSYCVFYDTDKKQFLA